MMLHSVVVHLKDSSILHGYYRIDETIRGVATIPVNLPPFITIEQANGSAPVTIDLQEAKAVFFVRTISDSRAQRNARSFDSLSGNPELWVRMTFRDGEVMEGRVSNGIDLLTQTSFRFFPVDELSNNRYLFVPKQSLRHFQVVGLLEP